MSDVYFGFDTSNYSTSFAVCDSDGRIVLNKKTMLNVKDGERGLRQSDAVFHHTVNMTAVSGTILDFLAAENGARIAAVGCSVSPCDREGSYMPCFLVGKAVASNVSAALNCRLYEFSHQAGHVAAALYGSGALHLFGSRFAAFHVSGGTTDVLLVDSHEDGRLGIERIGGTKDLNAGQIIDRAGVMMGLPFPSGRYLEAEALKNDKPVPRYRNSVNGLEFNLSGVENKAAELYGSTEDIPLVSAFVINAILDTLGAAAGSLKNMYPNIPVVYSGGVMSCSVIRNDLASENSYFAPPEFSSDNAAGIAYLTMLRHKFDVTEE